MSAGGKGQDALLLVPVEGVSYGFFPIESDNEPSTPAGQLLELVVSSESADCPGVSLRSADGHFHTGDLFLEVKAGKYLSQGRGDDWIKCGHGAKCDTR